MAGLDESLSRQLFVCDRYRSARYSQLFGESAGRGQRPIRAVYAPQDLIPEHFIDPTRSHPPDTV